jgi:hypothetical protein
MENQESLQSSTVIRQLANPIETEIHDFFANGVMATCKVVGSIFFAADELFRVEELTVCASAHLVDDGWLEIYKNRTRDVFACTSFTEESVEGIITAADSGVTGHLTIRLNAMFEAVQLPTSIADLDPGLSNVDRNALSHFR